MIPSHHQQMASHSGHMVDMTRRLVYMRQLGFDAAKVD